MAASQDTDRKPSLLFFVSEDWYFRSHRLGLAKAAVNAGYDVTVLTRVNKSEHAQAIRAAGVTLVPFNISRSGLNPLDDGMVVLRLIRLYRQIRPDITHHVAIKPILLGTIAAKLASVPHVVNAFAGLGFLYASGNDKNYRFRTLLRYIINNIFRLLFRKKNIKFIFQNQADAETLISSGCVRPANTFLIKGAGVDLAECPYTPEPDQDPPVVVMASRLIREKGVYEFVDAARRLQLRKVHARFLLVGSPDKANPSAVPEADLQKWSSQGLIEWVGWSNDMQGVIASSNIFCLPTYYREGLPKVLLEAASCGRSIVTTDIPGCREVVQHGANGLLVPPRNAEALADALQQLLVSPPQRKVMGQRSRQLAEQEFALDKVIDQTLAIYASMER